MASLAFPQLSTGVQVQYPVRKRRILLSPVNAFPDGSTLASNLNVDSRHIWDLSYSELSNRDQHALFNLFTGCRGAFLPFTFIDPTDNMLSDSTDLSASAWLTDPLLEVRAGSTDPTGATGAFTLVNSAQIPQQISQHIAAPASYQYCFSVYAMALNPVEVSLSISALSSAVTTLPVAANWTRLIQTRQLTDVQAGFEVSLIVPPGQTVLLFGPQLEPQSFPSSYRATSGSGGVYQNAHFLGDSITFASDAPGLFSTLISVESY